MSEPTPETPMRIINCTAATLRAMLCYIASGVTAEIAYDNDDLAVPLAQKLKEALGDRAGSQSVRLMFTEDESELRRQFEGCASRIEGIWRQMKGDFIG